MSLLIALQGGAASITGEAAITEAGDTLAAASALALTAGGALSEAGDTLAVASALALVGDLAVTESGDALSGDAVLALVAEAAISESGDTLAGASALALVGDLAVPEGADAMGSETTSPWRPTGGSASSPRPRRRVPRMPRSPRREPEPLAPLSAKLDLLEASDRMHAVGSLSLSGEISGIEDADALQAGAQPWRERLQFEDEELTVLIAALESYANAAPELEESHA